MAFTKLLGHTIVNTPIPPTASTKQDSFKEQIDDIAPKGNASLISKNLNLAQEYT